MSTISEAIDKRANWFYNEMDCWFHDKTDCCETGEQLDAAKSESMLDCTMREWLNQEQIMLLIKEAKKTGRRPPEMFGLAVAEWLESRKLS
jgi:hypothetical protein